MKDTGMAHSGTVALTVPRWEARQEPLAASAQPSLRTVLLLWFVSCALFVAAISVLHNYAAAVDDFGDNPSYVAAAAIQRWEFSGLAVKQFWGLSYVMAGVSLLTGVSDRTALLTVSFIASFCSTVLAYRLWGGWVASFFAVLNFDWMQRSFLGGAEPLFLALLFAAFLLARRERWWWAALLASLSTVVRPLGLFALAAIAAVLLWQRRWRDLALAILVGTIVGGLYVSPLVTYFGNPLANVNGYQRADWDSGSLLSWPFQAIIRGTASGGVPWTNLALTYGWIVVVLLAATAMTATTRFRQFARAHPVETMFTAVYLVFLCTYNSSYWARGSFPRFALPIVPMVLLALEPWIPKDRRVLWGVGIASPILAAASAIGISNLVGLIPR